MSERKDQFHGQMSEPKDQLHVQMAEFEMTVSNVLERRKSYQECWYNDMLLPSPASTTTQSPLNIKSPSPKPVSSAQVIKDKIDSKANYTLRNFKGFRVFL